MSSDKFHCTNGHCLTDCALSSIDYDEDFPPKICPHSGIEVYWQKRKNKPTIFDRITVSPEVLAPLFVYCEKSLTDGDIWYSLLLGDVGYGTKREVIAATVAKLKEQAQ